MAECRIVDKLAKFVPVRNDVLLMSVLRLLHNLSFDVQLRDDMVKNGLIPKVWQRRAGLGKNGNGRTVMTLASFLPSTLV